MKKLFEILNISAAPWKSGVIQNPVLSECFCVHSKKGTVAITGPTQGRTEEKLDNHSADAVFISCCPDMLESLINSNIRISKLLNTHVCGDLEKALMPVFTNNCDIIKKATGKSWEDILNLI